ncbi:uncharacterized protein TNCV_3792681 [Trichonephila clavipes]|nr:uncharacterized protein TNCV_3792681 [Trichonephila clavipes]
MKALKFYKELKESEPSTSSRESEVASADEEAARKYPEKLAKIIKDGEYCAHQVFNADETGLFWKKCQPVLTLQTIAEIKSQTLNACWKAAWPECVSKGNESNRAIVTSEIISIAKEIGGEGFDDFGEHDIEELLVDEALNDDDILESMVDITKDLETVDSEPEEDVTPLDEKLLREGLQLSEEVKNCGIAPSDLTVNENFCLYESNVKEIHGLIGADYAGKLFTGEIKNLPSGLVAMNTYFGWTVMARTGEACSANEVLLSLNVSDLKICDLWSLD